MKNQLKRTAVKAASVSMAAMMVASPLTAFANDVDPENVAPSTEEEGVKAEVITPAAGVQETTAAAGVTKLANEKWGGKELMGKSLLNCHNDKSREMILKVLDWFKSSKDNNIVYTFYNQKENKDVYMVALRNEAGDLIGYYEKHEYRNRETMKMYDIT